MQRGKIAQLRDHIQHLESQVADLHRQIGATDTTSMRAIAVRELTKLLPIAIERARKPKGSPALLRLILRSIKTL